MVTVENVSNITFNKGTISIIVDVVVGRVRLKSSFLRPLVIRKNFKLVLVLLVIFSYLEPKAHTWLVWTWVVVS